MSDLFSTISACSIVFWFSSFVPAMLVGQQPEEVLKQEVKGLASLLHDTNEPDAIFELLSKLKLHGSGAREAIPAICAILRDPRHIAKPFFFPAQSVHGDALDVLEAIGPESMDAITSLLEELHLTDNLTGDLLATGSLIAEKSGCRFPRAAQQVERMAKNLGDKIQDKEHLLGMAVLAYGSLAKPNEDSVDFLISMLPEEQTMLKECTIEALGNLGFRSPKSLAVLSDAFANTQVVGAMGDNFALDTIIKSYGQIGIRDYDIESYLLKQIHEDSLATWRLMCAYSLSGISETERIAVETLCTELRRVLQASPKRPQDIQVVALVLDKMKHLPETHLEMLHNCETILNEAVNHEELGSLRCVAFELLRQIDSPKLFDFAIKLRSSSHLQVRILAMDYLSEKAWLDLETIEAIYEGLVSDSGVKLNAARVLGRLGGRSAIYLDDLEKIWLDQSQASELRLEAYNAIKSIKDDIDNVQEYPVSNPDSED